MNAEEVAALERAIPEHFDMRAELLADAWRNTGQTSEALAAYERLLATAPPTGTQSYERASELAELEGNTTRALELLEAYVRQDPSSPGTCQMMVEISELLERHGDLDAARDAWRRAASLDAWKSQVIQRGAWLEWRAKNPQKMLAEYTRCAERYPSNDSLGMLGWGYLALNDEAAALATAEKGLALDFTRPACFELKAYVQRRLNKPEDARQTLESFNRRMIHDVRPADQLAWHYWLMAKPDKALEYAKAAMKRATSHNRARALTTQIRMEIELGAVDEARAHIRHLRALRPVDTTPDLLRARLALLLEKPAEALEALRLPLRVGGQEAHTVAALARLAHGDPPQALEHARQARSLQMFPSVETLLVLGDAAAALRKTSEAREAYEQCIRLQGPQTRFAKQARARLDKLP